MKSDLDNVYCGSIKRGDIFSVKDTSEKVCVVVQDDVLNERLGTVLVVPVEPHVSRGTYKNEYLLSAKETTFNKPGVCQPAKMFAADRHHMIAKRGELGKEKFQELMAVIDVNLGRFRDK